MVLSHISECINVGRHILDKRWSWNINLSLNTLTCRWLEKQMARINSSTQTNTPNDIPNVCRLGEIKSMTNINLQPLFYYKHLSKLCCHSVSVALHFGCQLENLVRLTPLWQASEPERCRRRWKWHSRHSVWTLASPGIGTRKRRTNTWTPCYVTVNLCPFGFIIAFIVLLVHLCPSYLFFQIFLWKPQS